MKNVVWTAVLSVMFGLSGVLLAVVVHNYAVAALCLTALSITFALLSNREGS